MADPPRPVFEELDFRETELGDLILRRRTILALNNREIHEVILGDAFLMSSLFTTVEIALADLGLAAAESAFPGKKLEVVVGGLGLGYTARATLENPHVTTLNVVDFLKPVIEWHEQGLVPLGPELSSDPRCRFVQADFFSLEFDPDSPDRTFHAVLLDIDHSPANLLHERLAEFY
ncbi:MAG: spermidine synthase, partial [Verrucomicrobiales bacterium]|nr:spermidine synthase [Verrucomicrobiales bacterium]